MIFMTWKGRVRKKLLLILVYSETQYPGSSKLKKMAKNCFGTFFALLLALLVQFQGELAPKVPCRPANQPHPLLIPCSH